MKRSILISTICAAVLLAAVASHSATCQLGVKGGVAIEKFGGDSDLEDLDSRTGFAGGAFLLADFSKSFGMRFEGLYIQKGAHVEEGGDEATFKLDYIEFPVLAVAHVPLSDSARLDFFGGPTFGFNVKSELELTLFGLTTSTDLDGVESFEFGVTLGAGVNFDVGSVVLGIDGRYGIGLTSLDEDDDPDTDSVKNRGFAVMGSIGFPLGQK